MGSPPRAGLKKAEMKHALKASEQESDGDNGRSSSRTMPDAHYNWGNALALQGKLAESILHYQQALQIKPDYADAHFKLGQCARSAGQAGRGDRHTINRRCRAPTCSKLSARSR